MAAACSACRQLMVNLVPKCTQVMEDVASAIALPVDFEESEDTYSFIADVPGLEKGDIKVGGPPQHAL